MRNEDKRDTKGTPLKKDLHAEKNIFTPTNEMDSD